MPEQVNLPPLTRLRSVDYALQDQPELKSNAALMAVRNYTKGSKVIGFPEYVWQVAESMIAANQDPSLAGKAKVIEFAAAKFQLNLSKKSSAPAPEATSAPAPAPQVAAKPSSSPVAPPTPAPAPKTEAAPVDAAHRELQNLPVIVAIYTMLVSAFELSAHDKKPGGVELRAEIEKVCNSCLLRLNGTAPGALEPKVVETGVPEAEEQSVEVEAPATLPPVPSAQ